MRKRGRTPKTNAPPEYVRFTKATELFQPLSKNTLNYRVRVGDIKTRKNEHGNLYEIESLHHMRDVGHSWREESRGGRAAKDVRPEISTAIGWQPGMCGLETFVDASGEKPV